MKSLVLVLGLIAMSQSAEAWGTSKPPTLAEKAEYQRFTEFLKTHGSELDSVIVVGEAPRIRRADAAEEKSLNERRLALNKVEADLEAIVQDWRKHVERFNKILKLNKAIIEIARGFRERDRTRSPYFNASKGTSAEMGENLEAVAKLLREAVSSRREDNSETFIIHEKVINSILEVAHTENQATRAVLKKVLAAIALEQQRFDGRLAIEALVGHAVETTAFLTVMHREAVNNMEEYRVLLRAVRAEKTAVNKVK